MDVWIYGHVHNGWQSWPKGSLLVQEKQHYPVRVLIGNGGFDNGFTDAVSFGHIHEEILPGSGTDGEDRVRVHFDIYDACQSTQSTCPVTNLAPSLSCWKHCKDFPGGYDGGGGPRKAVPTKHDMGFVLDAPRKPRPEPSTPPKAPYGRGAWHVEVPGKGFLGFGFCGIAILVNKKCLTVVDKEHAVSFVFYDQEERTKHTVVRAGDHNET